MSTDVGVVTVLAAVWLHAAEVRAQPPAPEPPTTQPQPEPTNAPPAPPQTSTTPAPPPPAVPAAPTSASPSPATASLAAMSRTEPATTTAATSTTSTTAPPAAPAPERDWHVGLNLRTDFAARFYRVDFGVRKGRLDVIAVVDPLGLDAGDYDLDGIVRYGLGRQWSVWGGARVTTVPIGRGRQYSDKLLAGVSAVMPAFGVPRTRLHSGLELAVHVVSHGRGLTTNYVCIDSPTCRMDHFVFSLFARFEYVSPF